MSDDLEDAIEVMIDPETEASRAHSAGRREFAEQLLHTFSALGGKPRAVYDQIHAVCTAEIEGTELPKHKREVRSEPKKGQTPDREGLATAAKEPRTGEEQAKTDAETRAEEDQAEADARADMDREDETTANA